MDFRSLIGKLEQIEQKQLLQESASVADQVLSSDLEILKEAYINLMERLNYKINRAAAKIDNEEERKKFLGNAAAKNGYPGLFDPVTGKFVDNKGEFAWFGAYKSEVEQMERDGLIPQAARTEALLGFMGKDQATAYGNSKQVADKDEMVDIATDIMAKGRQSWDPTASGSISVKEAKRGTLAQSITESFGYTFEQIVESITREEHKQLKDIIGKLKGIEGDPDVTRLMNSYGEYVRIRGIIIAKIEAILKELATLRAAKPTTVVKESREMLREEIYIFGNEETNEYSALKLYYDSNNNLVEYGIKDLGQDASDASRGAAKALTFGYSDNAVAGIKSLFKGTRYADELKRELALTDAAWDRSPYLYGAGYALGMAPYFLTGGVAPLVVGGLGAASELTGLRNSHNKNTMLDREKELANKGKTQPGKTPADSQKVQPTNNLPFNAEVQKIQKMMLAKDPKALPKYGADGKMGPETIEAAKRLGIALPSAPTASADQGGGPMKPMPTPVDQATAQQLMTALGAKDPTSAVTAFNAKVKAAGGDAATVIAQLVGLNTTPAPVKESITFSSMSDSERMSYLRNKMSDIDTSTELLEWATLGRGAIEALELLAGSGARGVMQALEKVAAASGSTVANGIKLNGQIWKPMPGVAGEFTNGAGAVMKAEDILHVITNTSTMGDKVVYAGQAYQKTASGWAAVGKNGVTGANANKNVAAAIEKEWAKTAGKNPAVPTRPATTPAANTATTPAANTTTAATTAANDAVMIPTGKVVTWVEQRFPRLTDIARKITQAGKVPGKFLSNKKWWAALAVLVSWGYIWDGITGTDPVTTDGPNGPVGPVVPGNDQKIDPEAENRKRRETELQAQLGPLVQMLKDMFPDDQETADILAKIGGGSEVQNDQKVVNNPRAYNTDFQPTTTSRFDK